ncbi:MAG: helical backbone metal receptor [Cyclobacteriaceae bacterium]|jgi:ABC-type Fe3+-hydroxamate transport system substrate-binding protein|nr:helical backbone metal receptor [Cyclobacteriaceae bacterium]
MQKIFVDQTVRKVAVNLRPKRIISLVPSLTDILHHLELNNETIGITKFCVHPTNWLKEKTIIGGTKNPDINRIISLQPDLILANKEENNKEDVEQLSNHFPVWVSNVIRVQDQQELILQLGEITNKKNQANNLIGRINLAYQSIVPTEHKQKVLYLIWQKPWMAAGQETFINSVLSVLGLENVIRQTRYPVLYADEIIQLKPDVVFLSSEPFPFKEKHVEELQQFLPKTKITLVDGEIFSWYGPRQIHLPDLWNELRKNFF